MKITIAMARRSLAAFTAIAALMLAGSATAQEKISFASLDRDASNNPLMLDGYLFKPDPQGSGARHPAVVFMHGCGGLLTRSGKVLSRETAWARELTGQGYEVLAVDSFTTRGAASECAHGGPVTPEVQRPLDAYGALRYLQAQPDVEPDRIALMGWSHGGGSVLFALGSADAARDQAAGQSGFRAAVAFYPGWCNVRSQHAADWHSAVPLLILMGASDVWTRAAPCETFVQTVKARAMPVDIHVYPGAYHDFDFPHLALHERPEFTNTRRTWCPLPGPIRWRARMRSRG